MMLDVNVGSGLTHYLRPAARWPQPPCSILTAEGLDSLPPVRYSLTVERTSTPFRNPVSTLAYYCLHHCPNLKHYYFANISDLPVTWTVLMGMCPCFWLYGSCMLAQPSPLSSLSHTQHLYSWWSLFAC